MSTATATRRAAGLRSASVSRTLAQAGLRPLPPGTSRDREGIRVRASHASTVRVAVDLDGDRERDLLAMDVAAALRSAGFQVEESVCPGTFLVTHARIAL
jgi:hypothetical protein